MATNGRVVYVDIAKGITILAVVLLHISYQHTPILKLTLDSITWRLPVFFCIAGFFIREEKLNDPVAFIKRKITALYIPALCFYLPATLLHNFFFDIGWYSSEVEYGNRFIHEWDVQEYVIGVLRAIVCAGREPIVGPMWFVYVLFFALCGLSIISFITEKLRLPKDSRFLILLFLQIASCFATHLLDFTIPRFSNTISIMLLIFLGQQLMNRWKCNFDNTLVMIISVLIVIQSTVLHGSPNLNNNNYSDALHLTVTGVCATYVVCYISRLIENNIIGRIINTIGRESLAILALHPVAFHLCTMFLLWSNLAEGDIASESTVSVNGMIGLIYMLFGVAIPVALAKLYRKIFNR